MSENSSQPPTDAIDHEMEFGIHPVRRPTNIERDVNSLEQKKRVSNILTSPVCLFLCLLLFCLLHVQSW